MSNESLPILQTRLASVTLVLSSALQELEAIKTEIAQAKQSSLPLPEQEWISIEEVAKLFGYRSLRACKHWAKKNGIQYHTIGKGNILFSREELNAKIKASSTPGGKPVTKQPTNKSARQEQADRMVLQLMKGK